MNFLAHLFLAGKDPGLIVGNILEDYITGKIDNDKNRHIPYMVKKGIEQHRQIDTLTDTDFNVKECKKLFYDEFPKYSGIIIDVLFDHFLIINWKEYTQEDFETFRQRIYLSFDHYKEIQPEKMQLFAKSMKEYDWLKNFEFDWGLDRAFQNLNSKINKADIDLRNCLDIFHQNHEILNYHFNVFFEKLKQFCDNFIDDIKHE